jgi:hypothetical protein
LLLIKKEKAMKRQRLICAALILGICSSVSLMINAAEKTAAKTAPATKAGAGTANIREMARSKALQIQKAIVTVRTATRTIYPGARGMQMPQQPVSKNETIGIVIDPNGLTVTNLSVSMDDFEEEMAAQEEIMMGMSGMRGTAGIGGAAGRGAVGRGAAGMQRAKPQIIKETSIIYGDGAVEPADFVLEDKDLGLAFVRPRSTTQFDAVSLRQSTQQPRILDDIFVVGRLGKNDSYALAVSIDSIRAVITKGSKSYYMSDKGNAGHIAFSADGNPIGLYVIKGGLQAAMQGDEFGMEDYTGMMGMGMMSSVSIIRPINDVIEAAKKTIKDQAPENPKSKEK